MSKRRIKLTDQIRDALATCGMTRYQIWKMTGIDQGTLSRFMAGKAGMTLASLDRLADVLELDICAPKRAGQRRPKK